MSAIAVTVSEAVIAVTVQESPIRAGLPAAHSTTEGRGLADQHPIAAVTGLQAALDAKAPLASPAFTDTPTAPTAAPDTSTTQIATTAFAKAEADAAQAAAQAASDPAGSAATAQAFAVQRANHTGMQLAATISDFAAAAVAATASAYDVAGAAATAQAYAVQRGNHTGTQLAATISDFAAAALAATIAAYDPAGSAATAQAAAALDATAKADAAQSYAVQRVNHTGTQLAATISDFNAQALAATAAAYDPAGSATAAQAFAVQRANHQGTQLAATISDFAPEVLLVVAGQFDLLGAADLAYDAAIQRANHTGTQVAATISDFAAAARTAVGSSVAVVGFDTAAGAPAYAEGKVYWDAGDHTLGVMTETSTVTLQVGQEMYIRATNKTGAPLGNGAVVYVSGAQGSRPTIAKAIATSPLADKVIGLCTADILDNATGYVSTDGLVRGLDTSAWVEGTELYVSASTAGALTDTPPAAPAHAVRVGIVTYQHATQGAILVQVAPGSSLSGLHDVTLAAVANKDALRYVTANSRWENTAQGAWLDTAQTWTAAQTFSTGTTTIATADINGGTIDGTVIGGAVPAAATVTTLTASGGAITVTGDDGFVRSVAVSGSGAAWNYMQSDRNDYSGFIALDRAGATSKWAIGNVGGDGGINFYQGAANTHRGGFDASGVFRIVGATASTSTTTGCATFAGGIGVAGTGYFGSGVYCSTMQAGAGIIVNGASAIGGASRFGVVQASANLSRILAYGQDTTTTGSLDFYLASSNESAGGVALKLTNSIPGTPGATEVLIGAGQIKAGAGITCTTLTVDAADYTYWGPSGTDGTWRMGRSGNDFVIQRRESGSYVTKQTIAA